MTSYTPPLADIRFVLNRLIGLDKIAALPAYDSVGAEIVDAVLDEAGKIAADKFAPLNEIGDRQGIRLENNRITLPVGCRGAYQAFVEGGWNTLAVEAEHGGQGLPWLVAMPVQEMLQGANVGLALCTLLNQGAIELLCAHGDATIKRKFLPKLVTGEWAGTMNLTEPQAGSDVGAVRTKAIKVGNQYRIMGQKIFISYGDHDLTDNILHLVLARLPDAPEGTRGLSLFLVPKILVNDDGSLGEPNDLRVVSLEHKLGQHVSPTCVMAYGDNTGAVGYLVGQENGGISAMFTMMNNARIGVGIQGLGLMERAFQHAHVFAQSRVQSRPIDNPKAQPVAIIQHPDVRRMLMSMKACTEAARALAYNCALSVDLAKYGVDELQRTQAALRVDLLTPIVKSWLTDLANEVTSTGVQVFGGMGYIEETGAAQHLRDARILAIYEGTNGIQGNDLVFRKLARDQGAAFQALTDEVDAFILSLTQPDFATLRDALRESLDAVKQAAVWLLTQVKSNPALAAAAASPFLRLCGTMLGGFHLIRSAMLAQQDLTAGHGDAALLRGKINTAHFYATHFLPQSISLLATIRAGSQATLDGLEVLQNLG